MATVSDTSDATHAVRRRPPSSTNSRSSGRAATRELQANEWATGSSTCWYTATNLREASFSLRSVRDDPAGNALKPYRPTVLGVVEFSQASSSESGMGDATAVRLWYTANGGNEWARSSRTKGGHDSRTLHRRCDRGGRYQRGSSRRRRRPPGTLRNRRAQM